jgi:hypothetical protein
MSEVTRETIRDWVEEALKSLGGSAHYKAVARKLWELHGTELTPKDDRFYTWQYDMRWASHDDRNQGKLEKSNVSKLPKGFWRLT